MPTTKRELQALVDNLEVNLGDIDTSEISDMSHLFSDSKRTDFTGIEEWDVSKAESMSWMFRSVEAFNQDIGSRDTSNVRDMSGMFYEASKFNQDISKWDTSRVWRMAFMFGGATNFNQDISSWDTSEVEDMECMFDYCPISEANKPLKCRKIQGD